MYVNILNKKVAVCTLGCKVNQYESDSMMDILKKNGCEIVPFSQFADVYIVNTCSVTNMAERKSRQMLHRAKKKNPEAVIVAAGCYVQAAEEALAKDLGIDILIGNNCKKDVARILSEYYEDTSMHEVVIDINHTNEYEEMTLVKPNERCRAYVKVQDGCNNFCTYCIIPYTRGRIRSRKLAEDGQRRRKPPESSAAFRCLSTLRTVSRRRSGKRTGGRRIEGRGKAACGHGGAYQECFHLPKDKARL